MFFPKQGYLRHIIESLVAEDVQLANLVNSRPDDHFKSLYTYETKMALLTRVASTATGSEMLLESSLMIKMAEMTVFSSRPETSNANFETMDDGFMPSGISQFHEKKFVVFSLKFFLSFLREIEIHFVFFLQPCPDINRSCFQPTSCVKPSWPA